MLDRGRVVGRRDDLRRCLTKCTESAGRNWRRSGRTGIHAHGLPSSPTRKGWKPRERAGITAMVVHSLGLDSIGMAQEAVEFGTRDAEGAADLDVRNSRLPVGCSPFAGGAVDHAPGNGGYESDQRKGGEEPDSGPLAASGQAMAR